MIGRRVSRGGRPGLIGTAARTAVVAGTATAVSGRVAARQQARQAAPASDQPEQPAAPAAAASGTATPQGTVTAGGDGTAVGAGSGGMLDQLERLIALHTQGLLTAEEFAAAKQRLLNV